MLISEEYHTKAIKNCELRYELSKLPPDYWLAPNDVKNLVIFGPAPKFEYLGIVDFMNGCIELWDEENDAARV